MNKHLTKEIIKIAKANKPVAFVNMLACKVDLMNLTNENREEFISNCIEVYNTSCNYRYNVDPVIVKKFVDDMMDFYAKHEAKQQEELQSMR